jgi:hypothetical protein
MVSDLLRWSASWLRCSLYTNTPRGSEGALGEPPADAGVDPAGLAFGEGWEDSFSAAGLGLASSADGEALDSEGEPEAEDGEAGVADPPQPDSRMTMVAAAAKLDREPRIGSRSENRGSANVAALLISQRDPL